MNHEEHIVFHNLDYGVLLPIIHNEVLDIPDLQNFQSLFTICKSKMDHVSFTTFERGFGLYLVCIGINNDI